MKRLVTLGVLCGVVVLLVVSGRGGKPSDTPIAVAQQTPAQAQPAAPIRPSQDVVRRNAYTDIALEASKALHGSALSARARYWLDEAQKVEASTGQSPELYLLDKMAETNQRLRALVNGRPGIPANGADMGALAVLALDQQAFPVAFYRLYNGEFPEGIPNHFQVEPGRSLKATADLNDERRLSINGGASDGK